MKSKLLILDSRDRQNASDSSTDYVVHMSKPMLNFKSLELKVVEIPATWYNISSAKGNNQLTFKEAGIHPDTTITIGDGIASVSELCTVVQAELNANSPSLQTYTVSYDPNTMKVDIEANTTAFILYGSNSTGKTTGLEQVLGFTVETASALTQTAVNVPSLLNPEYLLLNVDFICDGVDTLDDNKNASFVVPLGINYKSSVAGTLLSIRENDYWTQKTECKNSIQHFRVSLRDSSNELLDLNGADWTCIFDFQF